MSRTAPPHQATLPTLPQFLILMQRTTKINYETLPRNLKRNMLVHFIISPFFLPSYLFSFGKIGITGSQEEEISKI